MKRAPVVWRCRICQHKLDMHYNHVGSLLEQSSLDEGGGCSDGCDGTFFHPVGRNHVCVFRGRDIGHRHAVRSRS